MHNGECKAPHFCCIVRCAVCICTVLVGVISDTHGLLRAEVVPAFAGVDLILHAGDIGSARILEELRSVAPVVAVRGNVDVEPWTRIIPETEFRQIDGVSVYMLHDVSQLEAHAAPAADVVVSGHSHRPSIRTRGGVLFLNPGSAGPRRFSLPTSVALLTIDGGAAAARLVNLA